MQPKWIRGIRGARLTWCEEHGQRTVHIYDQCIDCEDGIVYPDTEAYEDEPDLVDLMALPA